MKLHWALPFCALLLITLGTAPAGLRSKPPAPPIPPVVEVRLPEPKPDPRDDRLEGISREDLRQQTRMARATEDLVRLTQWQVWVGVIGTIGVVVSLILSALATRAGFRAANAAERELAQATRPTFAVNKVELGDLDRPLDETDNGCTELSTSVLNISNRMAWLVAAGHSAEVVQPGSKFEVENLEMTQMLWPLKPNSWWGHALKKGSGVPLTEEQRNQIAHGQLDLIVFGGADYRATPSGKTFKLRYVYNYRFSDQRMVPLEHPFWSAT